MSRSRLRVLALLLAPVLSFVLPAAARAQAASDPTADPMSHLWGRQYTEWFYDGQADSLLAHFNPAMTQALTKENLLKVRDQIAVQAGNEGEVLNEEVVRKDSMFTYRRQVHFSNAGDTVILLLWTIGPDHRIAGFFVKPMES